MALIEAAKDHAARMDAFINSLPERDKQVIVEGTSHAATLKNAWPDAMMKSLDRDLVEYSGQFNTPQALYSHCASLIKGMKKKQFRQIQHRASLLYPSVKSPYKK